MKEILNSLKVAENRFWGTLLLLGGYVFPAVVLILWWKVLTKDEKVKTLAALIAWVLVYVVNFIPVVGQIAAIVFMVFIVNAIVKYYKGDLDYKIPLAYQIAKAIIK